MPKRVLIVEDHALLALSLQLALSARGWIVETTDGPTAADIIEHAHRFGPRSVLLDIRSAQPIREALGISPNVASTSSRGRAFADEPGGAGLRRTASRSRRWCAEWGRPARSSADTSRSCG